MLALRRTQNSAFCIATGCVRSTPVPHLHKETMVLPLREHTDMRGTYNFMQVPSGEEHPCSHLQNPIATSRSLRTTSATRYSTIHSSLPPTPLDRNRNAWIPQQLVSRHLESVQQNSLLGERPPPISEEELLSCPRVEKVHLSRLRWGHHPSVPAYEHRIRPELDPSCMWCREVPEMVLHLFEECPNLVGHRSTANISSIRDLWDSPSFSLSFLRVVGGPVVHTHTHKHTHYTIGGYRDGRQLSQARPVSPPPLLGRGGGGGLHNNNNELYIQLEYMQSPKTFQ